MKPSILLFGASSILGFHLARTFPDDILPFVPPGNTSPSLRHWPVLQLEDLDWIARQCEMYQPEILIYCHAVCDVSKCEADPDWAYALNVSHLRRVLEVLPSKTRLIYVSSDHVFGGNGRYAETSPTCPISVYGRTRLEAEALVQKHADALIIRPGLVLGVSCNARTGHMDWLRYRSERNLPITIIKDEFRSVVWADDLSLRVMQLAKCRETGLRHLPAESVVSRVVLANFLAKSMGKSLNFKIESRDEQSAPHLGHVELISNYRDHFSQALPGVTEEVK
ncbi:MAG: sugar nucleotide-binding protein [Nitrospirota bacterium]|nr:sugar nucleotide-binding protein [Nitrospirota bacterium]